MAKIDKWSIWDGFRMSRTIGRYLGRRADYTIIEFILAAERAAKQHPEEWVVFYSLGNGYMDAGHYARAVQVCQRCVELRPKDIRSTYALAAVYNALSYADRSEAEGGAKEAVRRLTGSQPLLAGHEISRRELQKLGMVARTAAERAVHWFRRSLGLKPDQDSRDLIRQHLSTLYKRYPQIEAGEDR